ncbi:MAG: tRNA pseudouridine(38-40) synthase TruA [Candidatus Limnocylindrales bacterium]
MRVTGAGRTDAGVHAIGQVINFRTASALSGGDLGDGVNALLPADIAISALEPCGEGFHARFSATGRTYEYRLWNAQARRPLERREHWYPQPLDLAAMRDAADRLTGQRDFSAFATGEGGIRTVRRAAWSSEPGSDRQEVGHLLRFEIEADAFLRGMVRAIVGTLLWVGRGTIDLARFAEIVAGQDRSLAGPSAPPGGLCLMRVTYSDDNETATREHR